jgi:Fe-S-cluster-containing hydrogenase component 2
MQKVISVDYKKCTGCRLCETVCSLYNEGAINPELSRVKMIRWEWDGLQIPTLCQQCDVAACVAVCPAQAIYRDKELGCMKFDYNKCIGCKVCLQYCPFGAITYNVENNKVIKCEYCGGDPMCVKYCETKALNYVYPNEAAVLKKRDLGAKILMEVSRSEGA